ncbi:3-oxoacyl-[acyl-carrier-protein] synthase, partial [Ceratobasidium sp. 423]
MEPTKHLGSEAEAKSWLDSVATEYARQAGITLSSGGGGGSATAGGGGITNSEEFLKSQAEQQPFAAQHVELYALSQDALLMWYDIIFGPLTTVDREIASCCTTIMNRANPTLLSHVQCHNDSWHPEKGETDALANHRVATSVSQCVFLIVTLPTTPKTKVNSKGDSTCSEDVQWGVRKLEAYIEEM